MYAWAGLKELMDQDAIEFNCFGNVYQKRIAHTSSVNHAAVEPVFL